MKQYVFLILKTVVWGCALHIAIPSLLFGVCTILAYFKIENGIVSTVGYVAFLYLVGLVSAPAAITAAHLLFGYSPFDQYWGVPTEPLGYVFVIGFWIVCFVVLGIIICIGKKLIQILRESNKN